MPAITGIAHVELTVRDLEISAAWYMELLGMRRVFDNHDAERGLRACALLDPATRTVIALTQHLGADDAPFDPRRPGLDHIALAVADRDELRRWEGRLAERGLEYTPLEEWSHGAAVTVRDPDGIAIEFYVLGPAPA